MNKRKRDKGQGLICALYDEYWKRADRLSPDPAPDQKPKRDERMGSIADLAKEGAILTDEIVSIHIRLASEIFGEKAQNPERQHIELWLKSKVTVSMSMPKGIIWDEKHFEIEDAFAARRSLQNKLSKFAAFMRKYGKTPEVGMKIETVADEKGFTRLAL